MDNPPFFVPELLRAIFDQLGRVDQVSCALVCQSWSEVALDAVWYEVKDVGALANIFWPVERDYSSNAAIEYRFKYPGPGVGRWSHFEKRYRNRIRILRGSADRVVSPLLNGIQRIQSCLPILPNLHTLEWSCTGPDELLDSVMFMHPGIRACIFTCEDPSDPGTPLLFEAAQTRMPHLVRFEFNIPPQTDVSSLMSLLTNLPCIEHLAIPAFQDASPVLTYLVSSTALKSLKLGSYLFSDFGRLAAVTTGSSLGADSFRVLESLTLTVLRYEAACRFFQNYTLCNLRIVTLITLNVEEATSVGTLFQQLSESCPEITGLRVGFVEELGTEVGRRYLSPRSGLINFDVLKKIFPCKKITDFEFCHPYILDLGDSDMEQIGLAWPQVEWLHLSHNSCVDLGSSRVTLRAVNILKRCCPKLKYLGLLFNTSVPYTPSYTSPNSSDIKLAELTSLHVGRSKLSYDLTPADIQRLSMGFAEVCGCTFRWSPDNDERWKIVGAAVETYVAMFKVIWEQGDEIHRLEREAASV